MGRASQAKRGAGGNPRPHSGTIELTQSIFKYPLPMASFHHHGACLEQIVYAPVIYHMYNSANHSAAQYVINMFGILAKVSHYLT
jgi:hypothetical protein